MSIPGIDNGVDRAAGTNAGVEPDERESDSEPNPLSRS